MRCRPRSLLPVAIATGLAVALGGCGSTLPTDPTDSLVCSLADELFAKPMSAAPLFRQVDGVCAAVEAPELDRLRDQVMLFADSSCAQEIAYQGSSFERFCFDNLLGNDHTEEFIGNPDAWRAQDPAVEGRKETPWTLSREATLRLAALDQTTALRPYVKHVEYRRVGDCALGMRVFTPHPGSDGLQPALFWHGGGWSLRGLGAVAGMGTTAPHLTTRGYVVFAPVHRLLGEADGPAECQGADGRDILDDAEAALDWILANGARYGMDPDAREVAVIGQSSGGHLATWLAVEHPETIRRGLLMYPLTDVPFVLEGLQPGGIYEGRFERGGRLLVSFLAEPGVTDPLDLDPAFPFAVANGFPERVESDPDAFGEFVILHGDRDETVPVEGSIRLCAALDPALPLPDGVWPGGAADLTCGPRARTVVIEGADHVLDLRCLSGDAADILGALNDRFAALCPSGSRGAERRVSRALDELYGTF